MQAGILKSLFNAQCYPRQVSRLTRYFLQEKVLQAAQSHILTDTGLPTAGQHLTDYVRRTHSETLVGGKTKM